MLVGADARSCESRCVRDRSFVGFVGYPEHYPGKRPGDGAGVYPLGVFSCLGQQTTRIFGPHPGRLVRRDSVIYDDDATEAPGDIRRVGHEAVGLSELLSPEDRRDLVLLCKVPDERPVPRRLRIEEPAETDTYRRCRAFVAARQYTGGMAYQELLAN